jgi:UDP-glucose 4-epimerase
MKNILITGGAGFIGANLTRLLIREGFKVKVLDNFSTGRYEYLEGLPLEIIEGDILSSDTLSYACEDIDAVIHLAAQTGVPVSISDPRKDCETNVFGTLNVLESVRLQQSQNGRRIRVIFASSNAPLGRQEPPAQETKAPLPISPYGASKLAGEGYCLAYNGTWGLETVVLRFANIYGAFSEHKNSVVAKFIKDIVKNGSITIDGDGLQTRDFIYVEDLCRAVLLALTTPHVGEIYQIATGVETSIISLANQILDLMGVNSEIKFSEPRKGDIRKNYSKVTKASKMLGWKPEVALNEGLSRTVSSFNKSFFLA